jgi:hypothetical protein
MKPSRFALSIMAVGVLASVGLIASQDARERQVLVSISGRDDAPTEGLTADAFDVRYDGKTVDVVRVAPAPPPSHLALVLDDSGAIGGLGVVPALRESMKIAINMVANRMKGTEVAVIGSADPPMMRLPFTAELMKAVPVVNEFGPRPQAGGTLLESLSLTIADLQQRKAARPVIVVFSAENSSEAARVRGNTLENALRESGASLWAVVFQARATGDELELSDSGDRAMVLGEVTRRSGGLERRINSPQGLTQAFERVLTMIASRYDVTDLRPAGATGAPRNFEVRSRKGGTVAAPRWAGE